MTVITLSRQMGAYGEEIAAAVAQTLDLRLVTAETINEAARRAGVPQMALTELKKEGESGLVNQMLKALRTMPSLRSADPLAQPLKGEDGEALGHPGLAMPFAGIFSPTAPPISASLDSYVRMVDLVIRGLAREGDVLIMGRGAQALLKSHDDVLHVQIVAPRDLRVEAVMAQLGLNKRGALHRIRASDRARADYLRRYHNANWLDPTLYHLVINTGLVPVDVAVELIVAVHKAMAPSGEGADA